MIRPTRSINWRTRFLCIAARTLVWGSLLGGIARPSLACVGDDCLQLWSTGEAGGRLVVRWDVTRKIPVYKTFCTPDGASCLFTAVDPGFQTPPEDRSPEGYYRLADGTKVWFELVRVDPGLSLRINGQPIAESGDRALLGTAPTLHNHPSWQLLVSDGVESDFTVEFRVTTDSPRYESSDVVRLVVTNASAPSPSTPTPTPVAQTTPTPHETLCAGDCNGDAEVTVDELVRCVSLALFGGDACPECDANGDGEVTVDEIVRAVSYALGGCPSRVPISLAVIQATIFSPRCAIPLCHDDATAAGNLELTTEGSYGELVGEEPENPLAAAVGLKRVVPGNPERSFLLLKLTGPSSGYGSRMPLGSEPLSESDIELVRNWILQGALP